MTAVDINVSDYSFYFNSARWAGVTEQFDLYGRHCIRMRSAFSAYLNLTSSNSTIFEEQYCVYVYSWCILSNSSLFVKLIDYVNI